MQSQLTLIPINFRHKIPQKQINRLLLLHVTESIAVISADSLHDIISLTRPRSSFPVSFDSVDQLRASILQSQSISMKLIQTLQHCHAIRVEFQFWWFVEEAKTVKLMGKNGFPNGELSSICSVQAIHTIYSNYSRLLRDFVGI